MAKKKNKIRNRIIISIVIILLLLLFFIPAIIFLLPEDEIIESDNPCDDGIDNDKDGLIDLNDLGCISKEDDTETLSTDEVNYWSNAELKSNYDSLFSQTKNQIEGLTAINGF